MLAYPEVGNPSDATVAEGESATFSVWYSASSEGLWIQWYVCMDGNDNWSQIGGANSSSYSTPAATADMNGWRYKCMVGNEVGMQESAPASLTVTHTHAWGETAYEWFGGDPAGDTATCTVSRTCAKCNATEQETASATWAETTPATCTQAGSGTYTATFESDWATTQTKAVTIPALGHSFTTYVSNKNATCTADATVATVPATLALVGVAASSLGLAALLRSRRA